MEENKQIIEVVYEGSRENYGAAAAEWLKKSGIAAEEGEPTRKESGLICHRFTALQKIAMDAAVIFVSDEATANEDWKKYINSLPMDIRLIPAGQTINVNYNDPEIIPPRLEEINFIRLDERMYDNLRDSLMTDAAFYTMKNYLVVKSGSWRAFGYEGNLLTDRKEISAYRAVISEHLINQKDEHFREQMKGILEYLDASDRYARKLFWSAVYRWGKRIVYTVLAIAVLIVIYKMSAYYKRASFAAIALSVDAESGDPVTGAIKMTEAITNPFMTDSAKKTAYEKFVSIMDQVWPQSPVGYMYKETILDAAIPEGSQYVWTSDTGGKAILWDTYTGQPELKEKLTDRELRCIAISSTGNTLAALDDAGRLYIRNGSKWNNTNYVSGVDANYVKIRITDNKLLIFDRSEAELVRSDLSDVQNFSAEDGTTVINAAILPDDRVLLVCSSEGELISYSWDGITLSPARHTAIKVTDDPETDILGETVITADENGQVWRFTEKETEQIPLRLPKVLALRFVNAHTVVYHERNIGTGLYDLEDHYDYGGLLADFSAVNNIYASGEMLVMETAYSLMTVSLNDILEKNPSEEILSQAVLYEERTADADLNQTNGMGPERIRIEDNGVIQLEMELPDGPVTVTLDPAMILMNSSGHHAKEDFAVLPPDEYQHYPDEPFTISGVPTVIGIRFVPANEMTNRDYYYILVGSSDGGFAELAADPEKGTMTRTCLHTVPSRAAITAIYQTEDGYILKDEGGRMWSCRTGISTISTNGIYNCVKSKLHAGFTERARDLVSEEVWDKLGLTILPGGDGKEWE